MAARLALAAAAPLALLLAAGCGAGSSGSAPAPVSVAPADSLAFAEVTLLPTGDLKQESDDLAERLTGADGLADAVLSALEESEGAGKGSIDFEADVAPWLGPEAGAFATRFDGTDLGRGGVILQAADPAAARSFVAAGGAAGSYRGVEFRSEGDTARGLVGDLVVIADGPGAFRDAVDAWKDESLAEQDRYADAIAAADDGSLADLYLDLGAMAGQAVGTEKVGPLGGLEILALAGVDPAATMVASVVPREETLRVDISSNLGLGAPGGDPAEALGALPAGALAAVGIPGFGEELGKTIDDAERNGLPGKLDAGELERTLGAAGIDLEGVAAGLGDAGAFLETEGGDEPGGALVIDASDPGAARRAAAGIRSLLRGSQAPGERPLHVISRGDQVAVGTGPAALGSLDPGTAPLSGDPRFRRAAAALGGAPIAAYVDGPRAFDAVSAAMPPGDGDELGELEPYLQKIDSIAIAAAEDRDSSGSTLVISFE